MERCDSIYFIETTDYFPSTGFQDQTLILNDIEELSRFLTTPQGWSTIETLEGGAELVPAKILSELPIAIHKAGTTLRQIHIDYFPVTSACSMVCPDRQDRLDPAWADLQAACRHLEKFDFQGGFLGEGFRDYRLLLAEEQTSIGKYLGAMLSGHSIEVVNLNFWSFGWYRIGSVLGAMKRPRIREARISNVLLNQDALEEFYSGLGYRLELISLHTVELMRGSWAGALDILREKVSSRCLEKKCAIEFTGLTGGGFGKEKRHAYTSRDHLNRRDRR
jgi:hypothetical protein